MLTYGWHRRQEQAAAIAPRQTGDAMTRLDRAMEGGDVGEVKRIIGAHREFLDAADWLASPTVLRNGDLVRYLLNAGLSPNGRNEDGTPLLMCGRMGLMDAADRLLHSGAEPGIRNGQGYTILMRAAMAGQTKFCKALIDAGADAGADANAVVTADPNKKASESLSGDWLQDRTALQLAARAGNLDVVKLLLSRGADPAVKNRSDATAAQIAARSRHPECAREIKAWVAAHPAGR